MTCAEELPRLCLASARKPELVVLPHFCRSGLNKPLLLNTLLLLQGLNTLDNPEAVGRLKYMLLCKIMTSKGDAEEVPAIISSRAGLKHAGDPPLEPHHVSPSQQR